MEEPLKFAYLDISALIPKQCTVKPEVVVPRIPSKFKKYGAIPSEVTEIKKLLEEGLRAKKREIELLDGKSIHPVPSTVMIDVGDISASIERSLLEFINIAGNRRTFIVICLGEHQKVNTLNPLCPLLWGESSTGFLQRELFYLDSEHPLAKHLIDVLDEIENDPSICPELRSEIHKGVQHAQNMFNSIFPAKPNKCHRSEDVVEKSKRSLCTSSVYDSLSTTNKSRHFSTGRVNTAFNGLVLPKNQSDHLVEYEESNGHWNQSNQQGLYGPGSFQTLLSLLFQEAASVGGALFIGGCYHMMPEVIETLRISSPVDPVDLYEDPNQGIIVAKKLEDIKIDWQQEYDVPRELKERMERFEDVADFKKVGRRGIGRNPLGL